MGKPTFGAHYYEDPSVSTVAVLEYDRLWARICHKTHYGVWFFRAREIVLAEEIPDIAKAYGKPVADRVQKAIQHTSPSLAPPPAFDKAKSAREGAEALMLVRGQISWINRVWLKWFGTVFW